NRRHVDYALAEFLDAQRPELRHRRHPPARRHVRERAHALHLRRVATVPARQAGRHDRRDCLSRPLGAREVLDNVVVAETPEGILLELRPAGLGARFYAFVIDWLVRLALIYVVGMITGFMGGLGFAFWLIFIFALEWFYPVIFE